MAGGGGLGVAAGGPLQSRVSVLRQTPGVQERVQVMMMIMILMMVMVRVIMMMIIMVA